MLKKNVLSLVLACVGLSVSGGEDGLLVFHSVETLDDLTAWDNELGNIDGRYGDYKDRALPPPDTERTDIPYYADALRASVAGESDCRLNVRWPAASTNFPTVVWFHGGGLTSGSNKGWLRISREIAQVSVSYRLMSETNAVRGVDCIRDAAAAVAWTLENIGRYGGDPARVYVSGHSAGAYLALMVGMDPKYLKRHGHDIDEIAGLVPISGQVSKHFNVREFAGDVDSQYLVKIGDLAPLSHCSRDVPPILSICGQPPWEWPMRNEENRLLIASCRAMGHPSVEFVEIPFANHSTVGSLGLPFLEKFIWGEMPRAFRPEPPNSLPVYWGPAGFGVREGIPGVLASASIGEIDFAPYEYLSVTFENAEDVPFAVTIFPTCVGESLVDSFRNSSGRHVHREVMSGRTTVKIRVADLLGGKDGRMIKRMNFFLDGKSSPRVRVSDLILERLPRIGTDDKEASKETARQEKRFAAADCGRGRILTNSARE